MLTRIIPSSQESLPVIGLGTWSTFDFQSDNLKRQKAKEVIESFTAHGCKLIDSSPMYGHAETVVGDIIGELKTRDKVFMATKVWTTGKQEGIEQMNDSFEKMRVDTMDLMQVHNIVDVSTHLETLRQWKEQGKIRYIGITHYTTASYPKLISLIKTEKPDFVQFNYNISTRDAEKKLLPVANDYGVAVIINRPFEEGALFSAVRSKALPPWAKEYNIHSWAQYFLKYIISHKAVTCVIPATQNPTHLTDFIEAGNGYIPDEEERERMAEYFLSL